MNWVIPVNDWNGFFFKNTDKLSSIEKHLEQCTFFPKPELIFQSFELCNLTNLQVVIIGQDCYHGKNQANGLCFSVNDGIPIPPSLRNILKEMKHDNIYRTSSDFRKLAAQGVLFLNSSLTVIEKKPGSHLSLWEPFTDAVIQYINDNCSGIVFILWGNYAKRKKKFITDDKHYILEGTHPSPLSANRGGFFNKKYFSEANKLIKIPIDWTQ